MRIKEIKLFKFEELSDKAKEKAMDWFREASGSDQWWENVYEDAANIGLKITEFDIDRASYAKGKFISGPEDCAHKIEKDGEYLK